MPIVSVAKCKKGDSFAFVLRLSITKYPDGIPARYTRAVWQARRAWDESLPLLMEASTDDDSIEIDHAERLVAVSVGASVTDALTGFTEPTRIASRVRFYDPANEDDRFSVDVPVQIQPDVIADD